LIILPYRNSTENSKDKQFSINFIYFGVNISKIDVLINGDFFLGTAAKLNLYHLLPFHINAASTAGEAVFFFDRILSHVSLTVMSGIIRAAYPSYANFNVSTAYAITWVFDFHSKISVVQVVLCAEMKTNSSFMIVSYARLNVEPDDQCCFYYDTALNRIAFQASTTEFNLGVPGQFVFQLNSIDQGIL
jgi:hypothetical protein